MKTWEEIHNEILSTPSMKELKSFIQQERQTKTILPGPGEVFNAYKFTPFEDVRIVIIGNEPYPEKNYSDGLAFSCKQPGVVPASLQNIFKEIILPSHFLL